MTQQPGAGSPRTWIERVLPARGDEVASVLWATAYFFFLFSGYYILRPVRDALGLEGGVRNLPWLFLATLGAMLAVNPVFSAIVTRLPRRTFIPVTYRFFAINLIAFYALHEWLPPGAIVHLGRVFYVWVSVFNLFVVSVFWGFMADIFRSEQGKRLFGFIAVGGTIGAVVGSTVTATLSQAVGPFRLLLVSAVLLEVAVFAVKRLIRRHPSATRAVAERRDGRPHPGLVRGALVGIRDVLASPYLAGITLYLFLYTFGSTLAYFVQAEVVARALDDAALRARLFASIDLGVNVLAAMLQIAVTGRILPRLPMAASLAVLPTLTAAGFAVLGLVPGLGSIAGFQIVRRGSEYGFGRPARELLFTVVPRADKYAAKNFIDTFVYRGGDALGAWLFREATTAVPGPAVVLTLAIGASALWAATGVLLGRRHAALDRAQWTSSETSLETPGSSIVTP